MSEKNFTDSTSYSMKDSDQENINSFEENYNFINIEEPEINEFKPPEHELNWNNFIQYTYHFKQDIERVWVFLKNFEFISLLINEGHFPCINIKGKDTWKVGNTFKGNLYKILPFIARVEKVLNLPEMKSIKWLFNNIKDSDYSN